MDTDNKYYSLIEKLVKNHRKFQGYESILDEIVRDVYTNSETIIKTIDNEAVIQSYLQKVVSNSMVTVPKRLNFHRELNHKVISANNLPATEQKNSEAEDRTFSESFVSNVSDNVNTDNIKEEDSNIVQNVETPDDFEKNKNQESLQLPEEFVQSNSEIVDRMINSIASDMVATVKESDAIHEELEENLYNTDKAEEITIFEDVLLEEEAASKEYIALNEESDIDEENLEKQSESFIADDESLTETEYFDKETEITALDEDNLPKSDDFLLEIEPTESNTQKENLIIQSNTDETTEQLGVEDCILTEVVSTDGKIDNIDTIDLETFPEDDKLQGIDSQEYGSVDISNDSIELSFSAENNSDIIEDLNGTEVGFNNLDLGTDVVLALDNTENEEMPNESNDFGSIEEPPLINEDLQTIADLAEPEIPGLDLIPEQQDLLQSYDDDNIVSNIDANEMLSENNTNSENNDEAAFQMMDYSVFSYKPCHSDSCVDDESISEEILKLQQNKPDLNILKIFELKYKQNMTISAIAEELHIDKENVVMALDELIKLV